MPSLLFVDLYYFLGGGSDYPCKIEVLLKRIRVINSAISFSSTFEFEGDFGALLFQMFGIEGDAGNNMLQFVGLVADGAEGSFECFMREEVHL